MIGTTLPQLAGRSTVGSLFRERARLHPDRCAVEAGGRTLTYGELNQRVNRAADAPGASTTIVRARLRGA